MFKTDYVKRGLYVTKTYGIQSGSVENRQGGILHETGGSDSSKFNPKRVSKSQEIQSAAQQSSRKVSPYASPYGSRQMTEKELKETIEMVLAHSENILAYNENIKKQKTSPEVWPELDEVWLELDELAKLLSTYQKAQGPKCLGCGSQYMNHYALETHHLQCKDCGEVHRDRAEELKQKETKKFQADKLIADKAALRKMLGF